MREGLQSFDRARWQLGGARLDQSTAVTEEKTKLGEYRYDTASDASSMKSASVHISRPSCRSFSPFFSPFQPGPIVRAPRGAHPSRPAPLMDKIKAEVPA